MQNLFITLFIVMLLAALLQTVRLAILKKHISLQDNFKDSHKDDLLNSFRLAMKVGKFDVWRYDFETSQFHYLLDKSIVDKMSLDKEIDAIHPDYREKYKSFLSNLIQSDQNSSAMIIKARGGGVKNKNSYLYIEIAVKLIRDSAGNPISMIGTNKDVTQQVLERRELERVTLRYQAMFNSLGLGIEIYDSEKRLIEINEADLRMFGVIDKFRFLEQTIYLEKDPAIPEDVQKIILSDTYQEHTVEYDFDKISESGYYETSRSGIASLNYKTAPLKSSLGDIIGYVVLISDVTDVQKYINEIEKAKLNLSLALDAGNVSVWVYDVTTKVVNSVQGNSLAGSGMTVEENDKIIHPADIIPQKKLFEDILEGVKNKAIAVFRYNIDGEYRFYECKMRSYSSCGDGKITHIIGTQRDVTESYIRELKIHELSDTLEMVISAGDMAVWRYVINERKFYSYSGIIKNIDGITYEDYAAMLTEESSVLYNFVFTRLINGESEQENAIFNLIDADTGNYIFVKSELISQKDEFGNIAYIYGTYKDITAEINKQQILNDTISQNKIILDNINSGLVYVDKNYNVLWENVSSVLSPEFKDGTYYFETGEFCHKNSDKMPYTCAKNLIEKAFSLKTAQKDEQVVPSGISEEIFASPVLNFDDNVEGVVLRIDNISKRKRMIQDLKEAKDAAEVADRLKSAFLANMSHEIRTPLNAIVGFSQLLQMPLVTEERDEYIKIINTNNDLLLRLINDILDLSKIESGMLELKTEPVDFVAVFEEYAQSLRLKLMSNAIEFLIDHPYESCIVGIDKNRVIQVLTNFGTNAVKYTSKGYIKIGYRYVDHGLRIYVEDSGIGIPDNKKNRVFRRFEKLDDFAQGTGLGLSICKAIVDACGGKIGFESEERKGSVFWAWFPCDEFINGSGDQGVSSSVDNYVMQLPNDIKHRILIAEDNDSNFLLLQAVLKGYDITRAFNGNEAVELQREKKYDLIFMDISMPVMDGITAVRKIREFDENVLIAMVTANAFDSDRIDAFDAGCNYFLTKPLKKEELLCLLNPG